MDVTLKAILMEFLRDAKSRKFLLVAGFLVLPLAGMYLELWQLSENTILVLAGLSAGLIAVYLLVEGLADYVSRKGRDN